MGADLCDNFRKQSLRFGTTIFTETVTNVDLSKRPFLVETDDKKVLARSLIVATGAVARRLNFKGAGEGVDGYWNKGISACAVCDGAAPIFRNKPLAVIGGGDTAMEEASFLSRYGSKVYIIHRREELRASKFMQSRAKSNPKIEFVLSSEVVEAFGEKLLRGIKVQSTTDGSVRTFEVNGLFFAIGHDPATAFLKGQLALDGKGYIMTKPGQTSTNVQGVFACGDVQDSRWRQAITAAGTGCMAALEAEHFLSLDE